MYNTQPVRSYQPQHTSYFINYPEARSQVYESPYSQQYYNNMMNQTVSHPMQGNRQLSNSNSSIQQDDSLTKILEKQCLTSRINLQEMYINDEGARKLAQVLMKYKNINFIELKGNNISGKGFIDIFEALKSNFQIKVLGLQWNRLGGNDITGLENLYSLMANNRSITHLDLRNNRINQTGAHIIANIIRTNNTLHSLDLRWNEIGNNAARAILASCLENYSLISLELAGNSVSENILQQIQQVTSQNREGNQRNVRRVMVESGGNQGSLNDRDLDFMSRQQFPGHMSQYSGDQGQHFRSSSNLERMNRLQQSPPERQLPYEQEQILQHLESLIEEERVNSLQLKEQLTKRIEEKKSNLDAYAAQKSRLEEQMAEVTNTNNILKNDLRDLQQDLKAFEVSKKNEVQDILKTNHQIENQIRENDKIQQEQIMALQEKNLINIKSTEQDWEEKAENLQQQYVTSKAALDDGRMAIHRIQDEMIRTDLENKEKAKETIERIKIDTKRDYKLKFDILQSRLNKMIQGKLEAERTTEQYISQRLSQQREFANQVKDLEVEITKREVDKQDIQLLNIDFDIQEKKLKNDIKNKENIERLLEQERDGVQRQFTENEREVRKIQDEMDQEHKKEIHRVEGLLEVQRKRISELESAIKDSQQQNHQLRSDYTRLQELLQGNLSTVIYTAFREKNVV